MPMSSPGKPFGLLLQIVLSSESRFLTLAWHLLAPILIHSFTHSLIHFSQWVSDPWRSVKRPIDRSQSRRISSAGHHSLIICHLPIVFCRASFFPCRIGRHPSFSRRTCGRTGPPGRGTETKRNWAAAVTLTVSVKTIISTTFALENIVISSSYNRQYSLQESIDPPSFSLANTSARN